MRVLLVGNYLLDRQYSMLGFGEALAQALPGQGLEVTLLHPRVRLGKLRGGRRWAKWAGYLDKFALFRGDLRRQAKEHDLVHVLDQGNALWVPWIEDRPHLVTVHDLLALRAARGEFDYWPIGSTGQKLQEAIQRGLGSARYTAAISEATRNDLRRLYPSLPEPLLIPNGLYRPFTRLAPTEARQTLAPLLPHPQAPFLVHVGGNSPYKNRIGAVRIHAAMRRLDPDRTPRLVLAGHAITDEIRAKAEDGLRDGSVVEVRNPSDAEVQALYSLAEGLLFPSFVEGFGLPVLEAQACGCPVFASERGSLPEVGGPGAAYFDPSDPEGTARSILEAWDRRPEFIEAGYRNVASRTTEHMATAYAAAYRTIAG